MYYTGIDLHKKTSFITTIDESGKVVFRRNFANQEEHILDYFVNLDGPTKIVIESMCSWYWLYDLLTAHNFNVVISNPLKTKAIASAKIKNDKVDSHMLAQLLRADLIATVHVCSLKTRKLKELLRHRRRLVQDATRMKNRIHMLLMKNNISIPVSDLFGVKGHEVPQRNRSSNLPPTTTHILSHPLRLPYPTDRTADQTHKASGRQRSYGQTVDDDSWNRAPNCDVHHCRN